MPPRVITVDRDKPDPAAIAEAAKILARGGLVAFPTETVYGLGARGLHAEEVRRIFIAKGRPSGHPVILHVDGETMARTLGLQPWPDLAARLASAFWPGPLTLVVPRSERVPSEVSGGLATVGIRAPRHPVALALIRAVGEPLAAPSANAHTHVSPTTAAHVVRSLGDRPEVELVLDAGPCAHGIESTVLTLAETPPRVLRPGAVSLEELRRITPDVQYANAGIVIDDDAAARASPGMAAKHYAPRTKVVLFPRGTSPAVKAGRIAAIVATSEGRAAAVAWNADPLLVLPDSPDAYAHDLFAALHTVDEAGVDVLLIEDAPANDPRWWAVTDRLVRAARH